MKQDDADSLDMPMPFKTSSIRQEDEVDLGQVSAFRKKFEEAKSQDPSHVHSPGLKGQNQPPDEADLSYHESDQDSDKPRDIGMHHHNPPVEVPRI